MSRLLNTVLLAAAFMAPVSIAPLALADDHDRVYHDGARNDDHHWDRHEDRAYRIWVKDNHRRYRDFGKLRAEDQAAYWAWRHEHSDAALKIDIR